MDQTRIFALDFDGVICDSAVETGVAGWKAGKELWSDYEAELPSENLIKQFCKIRPAIETGYEAILVIRLLYQGNTTEDILNSYPDKLKKLIDKSNLDINMLKKVFGATRDQWINNDLDDWVAMNPLFTGIAEKLQVLSSQNVWYIITTKQERFVKHILTANQIKLPDNRIFGLDRKMSKEAVLEDLVNRHSNKEIYFVEDRLPTLFNVLNNKKLASVKLFFALWGYNSELDKTKAKKQTIQSIELEEFLV